MFHALIPAMKRRPSWWRDTLDPQPDARAIEQRHLDVFDCDYVVDARQNARDAQRTFRTITFGMLRTASEWSGIPAGLPASAIWHEFWDSEYRFSPRGLPAIVLPRPPHASMKLFCDVCFGRLARVADLGSLSEQYRAAFEPADIVVSPSVLLDGFSSTARDRFVGPLQLGAWGLRIHPAEMEPTLVLFLLDPSRTADLAEFWNLRALGSDVVPIPLEWTAECAPLLGGRTERPRGNRRRWRDEPMLLHAHQVPEDAVITFARALAEHGLDVVRGAVPDYRTRKPIRARVTAREDRMEESLRSGRFQIRLLAPEAGRHYPGGVSRWMNVISPLKWTLPSDGSLAPLLPPALGQVNRLFGQLGPLDIRATEEGIAIPSGSLDEDVTLELPSGRSVIAEVFRTAGLMPRRSDPGSIADRLIAQLGGMHTVPVMRHWDVLTLLNSAAGLGAIIDEAEEPGGRRRHAAFFKYSQLQEALRRSTETDVQRANVLATLVNRDVLRAGLTLSCAVCGYTNWVELGDIGASMRCERCLQEFSFPVGDPPTQSQWAYRPTGAFSVPDFANGSYSVAFALNWLQPDFDRMTWCTGTHLGKSLEVDFAAFREERDGKPALILGEAKSQNRFTSTDFDRAARLRRLFPDAVLAFATLRNELADEERHAFTQLARPTSRYAKQVPIEPQVLVLTGAELLHLQGPPDCWKESTGRAAELSKGLPDWGRSELASWCDLTLQLHVGLDAHRAWARTEYERLAGRRLV